MTSHSELQSVLCLCSHEPLQRSKVIKPLEWIKRERRRMRWREVSLWSHWRALIGRLTAAIGICWAKMSACWKKDKVTSCLPDDCFLCGVNRGQHMTVCLSVTDVSSHPGHKSHLKHTPVTHLPVTHTHLWHTLIYDTHSPVTNTQ